MINCIPILSSWPSVKLDYFLVIVVFWFGLVLFSVGRYAVNLCKCSAVYYKFSPHAMLSWTRALGGEGGDITNSLCHHLESRTLPPVHLSYPLVSTPLNTQVFTHFLLRAHEREWQTEASRIIHNTYPPPSPRLIPSPTHLTYLAPSHLLVSTLLPALLIKKTHTHTHTKQKPRSESVAGPHHSSRGKSLSGGSAWGSLWSVMHPAFCCYFFLTSQMQDFKLTVACGNCWVPKLIEKNYNYCTVLYVLHWCFKVLLRFSIFASLIFVHSLYRHTYIHISKPTNKPVLIWLSLP